MTPLRFSLLAQLFKRLEGLRGNAARNALAAFFRSVPKKDISHVVFLCTGRIASEFEGVDLGMAGKMVLRALGEATGLQASDLARRAKRLGDIGDLAQQVIGRAQARLAVLSVFRSLHAIATSKGKDSQRAKTMIFARLLRDASPIEAKYACRLALGNLRLGIGDKTVLDALAVVHTGSRDSKKLLESAYNICPDIGLIADTLARKGLPGVRRIGVHVGRPIQMMLCQRLKVMADLPRRMALPVAVEEKYDGERIQAHIKNRIVTLYSRRLENITLQFPDVVAAIRKQVKARSAVIEGEVMPVDKTGDFLPFQILMSRRRKHGVAEYAKRIPVVWCVFDIVYCNDVSLIGKPYRDRWGILAKTIAPGKIIRLSNRSVCPDIDCVEEKFNGIVERGGEGIVIKSLAKDSAYQAGVRGWHWVKWKPEYLRGMRDTFDLVVVGAYRGRGRRAGGYGALLCAAYDAAHDRFGTFCKVGTGFSDKMLAELPHRLNKYKTKSRPKNVLVAAAMMPDVWFSPAVVCEVVGANVTPSPNHTAGVSKGKGFALRFPRFIRWRDEKSAVQATSMREIARMSR